MSYNRLTSIQANYQKDLQTLEGLRAYIACGKSKQSRPLANNTTARLTADGVAIRLHDTDIIIFREGHDIELHNGGWFTVTTKERINRYTMAGITQKNGIWYMRDGSLFYDGMLILPNGQPKMAKMPEVYERKLKEIKKLAKTYAKNYVQELQAGRIPFPSSGDCWYCLMFKGNGNTDHIKQHIKERYYVPSLLVNAGRAAGYRDQQIGLMGIGGQRVFINPERNIYKYIVKKLQGGL